MDSVHDVIVQSNLRDAKASLQYLFFFFFSHCVLEKKKERKQRKDKGQPNCLDLHYRTQPIESLYCHTTPRHGTR